jgi:hypothetical protein
MSLNSINYINNYNDYYFFALFLIFVLVCWFPIKYRDYLVYSHDGSNTHKIINNPHYGTINGLLNVVFFILISFDNVSLSGFLFLYLLNIILFYDLRMP